MYHFIYKTSSSNGRYYVGRHSTSNLDDGYLGSGKWVRSVKDKSILSREILKFFDSVELLKEAEAALVAKHLGEEGCMNFSNSACGFSSGDLNPAKLAEERERRSARISGDNNPAKRPEVAEKISAALKGRPARNKGIPHTQDARDAISKARTGCKYSDEGRAKLSESRKAQYENGERCVPSFKGHTHSEETRKLLKERASNRERLVCPHCEIEAAPGNYKRWHGENCKLLK